MHPIIIIAGDCKDHSVQEVARLMALLESGDVTVVDLSQEKEKVSSLQQESVVELRSLVLHPKKDSLPDLARDMDVCFLPEDYSINPLSVEQSRSQYLGLNSQTIDQVLRIKEMRSRRSVKSNFHFKKRINSFRVFKSRNRRLANARFE